jgi:2'-5' RNA ligase
MTGETLRAFIAVPLPETVSECLERLSRQLQAAGLRGRWVPPGNIHLTLKFLGDIDAAAVAPLAEALGQVAREAQPIRLTPVGLGAFPRPQRARVLWVGLAGDLAALGQLKAQLDACLETLGYPPEKRPWAGHLTLARARGEFEAQRLVDNLQIHQTFTAPSFDAQALVLYRSLLTPGGALYRPLARLAMGRGGAVLETGGTP